MSLWIEVKFNQSIKIKMYWLLCWSWLSNWGNNVLDLFGKLKFSGFDLFEVFKLSVVFEDLNEEFIEEEL